MEDQFGGRTDDDLFYDDFEPVDNAPSGSRTGRGLSGSGSGTSSAPGTRKRDSDGANFQARPAVNKIPRLVPLR
ncbi:hypothetical protein OCS_04628 [Ophiocordyceps sinensis CO18]|uniref:Uncharacterized protein n=1 Tax=Ophiocordyceps sinensis (strain Co18 / CGMCC 3.14243) TaxID=911162 RepID=T5AAR6_OPHSC|nr:hypothetical protein OCS_04628 [Ophiocordyceps sinensis CO18]